MDYHKNTPSTIELIKIGKTSKCKLSDKTIELIQSLNLNRKKTKTRRGTRGGKFSHSKANSSNNRNGINLNNLIKINCVPQIENVVNVHLLTVNAAGLRDKEIDVRNFILEKKVDACFITETFYKNDDGTFSDLNTEGLKLSSITRKNKPRGGIALTYQSIYKCEKLKVKNYSSMECGLWKLTVKGININILGIYRPPYSISNKITDTQAADDFLDLLSNTLSIHNNVMVLGDLNFHWNDNKDSRVQMLKDGIYSLGLEQLVNAPTHRCGNILDVAIVESSEISKFSYDCSVGEYLSDHKYVMLKAKTIKQGVTFKEKNICNLKIIQDDKLQKLINDIDLKECETVTKKAEMLESELLSILDEMAPIEPKLIRERIPKPWYNENINQARKDYRKTCRKWSKSRNKDDWKAYKVLRNAYVKQLNEAKKDFYCSKIQSNKGNTKDFTIL